MSIKLKFLFLVFIITIALHAQTAVKGIVRDGDSGLPLTDVEVSISDKMLSTTTNDGGEFSFTAFPGGHKIYFQKLGYRAVTIEIHPTDVIQSFDIRMTPALISKGEILVTGLKRELQIRETPVPMEVIHKDRIDNSTLVGVPDILRNEPGVALARDGVWGTDINIRGLSRQNIVTLIDGNRIETASNHAAGLSLIDLSDVQRIEVIKGGISSLYGTGATGGVINVIMRQPGFTNRFQLKGSFSALYNTVNEGSTGNISLTASAPIWYGKISGTLRSAVDARTPAGLLPNSFFHDNNISTLFGIQPVEDHQLILNYQKFDGKEIGIPGGKTFPVSASAKYLEASRELFSGEYIIRGLIPSLTKTSLKYFSQKIFRSVELKPSATQTINPAATHSTYGLQLQTDWLTGGNTILFAGVNLWQRTYDGSRQTVVKTGGTTKITYDLPVPHSEFRSLGFFAQEELSFLNDQLKVMLGGRYDLIRVTNDAVNNPLYVSTNGTITYPPKNPQASFAAGTYNDQSWSANIGALYHLMSNIDVTMNIARAFRSPVLEERFQYINLGGDIYLGNPNLNSELGTFFDLGIRIWGDNFTLRADGFFNSFTDLVIDMPVIKDSLYQKMNVGSARFTGVDLSAEWNAIDKVVLYGTASYVKGEDTKANLPLPQIPPVNGRIGIKYTLLEMLDVNFSAAFFSDQNNFGAGETRTPGYTTFHFSAATREFDLYYSHLHFSAGIDNITDKLYRDHLSTLRGLIKNEPGRNVYVKMQINW